MPNLDLLLLEVLAAEGAARAMLPAGAVPVFVQAGVAGVAPGRVVYDTVTGRFVEVLGVGNALLGPQVVPEEVHG